MAQVVEYLPLKQKALNSNPQYYQKTNNRPSFSTFLSIPIQIKCCSVVQLSHYMILPHFI
jgi:hypothetical protein